MPTNPPTKDEFAKFMTDRIRQAGVKGDHIAMIPNRENLIVVGSEDFKGLAGMAKLAAKAMKEPCPISGIALRLDGDESMPWLTSAPIGNMEIVE